MAVNFECLGLETLLFVPRMGSVVMEDLSLDHRHPNPSLCNANMYCTVQCSYQVWNLNPSRYLNPCPAM